MFILGSEHKKLTFVRLVVAATLIVTASACRTSDFGRCDERSGSVSPACLYTDKYPACELNDEDYELARQRAWRFPDASFSEETFVNTGKSQDLGNTCRFYFHVNLGLHPAEPYQWMVYVDKQTLRPTHIVAGQVEREDAEHLPSTIGAVAL